MALSGSGGGIPTQGLKRCKIFILFAVWVRPRNQALFFWVVVVVVFKQTPKGKNFPRVWGGEREKFAAVSIIAGRRCEEKGKSEQKQGRHFKKRLRFQETDNQTRKGGREGGARGEGGWKLGTKPESEREEGEGGGEMGERKEGRGKNPTPPQSLCKNKKK